MQTYKELLNQAVNGSSILKKLGEEDAMALRNCILDIYKKVADICEANHLLLMLAGGSCLGAVRHQGFIPWDDDLDVMMPRSDYEKFIKLCEEGALGNQLEFRHPNGSKPSRSMFLKIYMKGTKMTGIDEKSGYYPDMVFLDIFPLDGMPSCSSIRRAKGLIANGLRFIANVVAEYGPLTDIEKKFYAENKSLRSMFLKRRFLGRIFSVINHQHWIRWFDSFVRCDSDGGLIGIPTGRKLYNGEVFPAQVFFPPCKGVFEGLEVNLPSQVDIYLKNLYGNYMWIPPEEKRESHWIIELILPQKYYGSR